MTLIFEVNVIHQHHRGIRAELVDQIHNLPSSFLPDLVVDKLRCALRVVEVGVEESGLIDGHGVIKESRKEWQLQAQQQGAVHTYLQPVGREVESVQKVLEAPVHVRY